VQDDATAVVAPTLPLLSHDDMALLRDLIRRVEKLETKLARKSSRNRKEKTNG
jgi:hypothetical protein